MDLLLSWSLSWSRQKRGCAFIVHDALELLRATGLNWLEKRIKDHVREHIPLGGQDGYCLDSLIMALFFDER